jgi:lantibiotic leader peptide-processing serine protease
MKQKWMSLLLACGLAIPNAVNAQIVNEQEHYYSILLHEEHVPENFKQQLTNAGVEIVYEVEEIGFLQVKATADEFEKIRTFGQVAIANPAVSWEVPEVEQIPLDAESYTNSPLWDLQWDIQRITQNGASYELGTGSHDVVVAIIDTGIDRDHPDLVVNLLPGSKNFVPEGGFRGTEPEETGDPNAFDDKHGHGSHVAGSIAANGNMVGVAPNTGIRAYRVFGTGSAESAWIYEAMIAAANDGADVISMSLGGFDILGQVFYVDPVTGEKIKLGNDVADFLAYQRAVQYVTEKGSLVVVAAGNDGINATNKREVTDFLNAEYGGDGFYFQGAGFEVPGTIPGVITVSATGPNDELALYSNYGPGFIDIAAPGGDYRMYLEYLANGTFDQYLEQQLYRNEFTLSTSENGGYYYSIGTSMATPKVSAVAALLVDKYGKMEPHKLAELLRKKAVDPVKAQEKKVFGAGHLNALNALQ